MAAKSMLKMLTDFFNVGDGKRGMKDWAEEVKALSPDEKRNLCTQICEITGDTILTK